MTDVHAPRRLARVAVALLLTLPAIAACGSDDSAQPTAEQAAFDHADVAFAQSMIPHHDQAVLMAKLAATRSDNTDVRRLAKKIIAAQQPETATMKSWLRSWGEPEMAGEDGTAHPLSTGEMPSMNQDMPGMAADADLAKLKAASGRAFDRLFLTLMIAHHRGALAMADIEKAQGKFPAAVQLARAVLRTQGGEIAMMQKLLKP
jgi:uncharacterized protein (DUF305 family)